MFNVQWSVFRRNQGFARSSRDVGDANEACEPESDADFVHNLKIGLKELKGSRVWLRFANEFLRDPFIDEIIGETREIANMMGASMRKRGQTRWSSPLTTAH